MSATAGPQLQATAEYLTAAQVAGLLQVSAKSVYRWAAADPTFPMLKLGGTVRFPRERLMRWLRDSEQGPGRQLTRGQVRRRSSLSSLCPTFARVCVGNSDSQPQHCPDHGREDLRQG